MEAKFCPDIDEGDDSRVSITVYGERPGESRVFECTVLLHAAVATYLSPLFVTRKFCCLFPLGE